MTKASKTTLWIAVVAIVVLLAAVVVAVGSSNHWFALAASTTAATSRAATSPASPSGKGTTSPAASPTSSPSASPTTPAQDPAVAVALSKMSTEQKVGQILMVSAPATGANQAAINDLSALHVGNFFLKGRSSAGSAATLQLVNQLKGSVAQGSGANVAPFVATDQEGGQVQILSGQGFSTIPAAIDQAAAGPAQIKAEATQWGQQLAATGINVNFAPVLDTVPSPAFAPQNAPIGAFGREYGYDPAVVASSGVAAAQGFAAGNVVPTVKHFPGLGRVTANTDTTTDVTDNQTVRHDQYLQPFDQAVQSGVDWVMLSNAYYPKIDPKAYAPFSSVVINDMLRGDLGFKGVVVSDDMCDAVQVSPVPLAERGVDFIAAGGTMALCTDENKLPAMYQGLVDKAHSDPAFAKLVDAAAAKMLGTKKQAGLLN